MQVLGGDPDPLAAAAVDDIEGVLLSSADADLRLGRVDPAPAAAHRAAADPLVRRFWGHGIGDETPHRSSVSRHHLCRRRAADPPGRLVRQVLQAGVDFGDPGNGDSDGSHV